MQAILTRRSIRKYTSQPVPEKIITGVLEAAMSAPSAGNQQPWHFVVITDRETLDSIPVFHPHTLMLKEASTAILVCGDPSLEKHQGYWVQDCAAATQNLLLAAHALGLGAVWTGFYPREDRVIKTRQLLGLPEHVIPLALVPIGYPAEEKPPAKRYDASRVHFNRW
ncbi:MAG: nitroreductase family protein [Nitrospirae bacterium]|nr:nitroreductase family protein [Nitrospirota bacterium]